MLQKLSKLVDNNFFEKYLPFFPRLGAKYKFLIDDMVSFFNYYILFRRKIVFPPIHDSFGITITTFCNAKCGFCAYRYLEDKKEILGFKLFKKAIDEFYSLGGRSLGLTPTIGDVLTDPEFSKKIAYLNKKEVKFSLYTNGILLHKEINNLLASNINELHIDLGDILPEIDAQIFNISSDQSKQRLNSVLCLLKEIDKKNIQLDLFLDFRGKRSPEKIMKSLEKSEFNQYRQKGLFKMAFLQAYDNWGGSILQSDLLGIQTLKIPPKFKKYPCRGLFVLSILPNGDIRLCGCRCKNTLNDELVLGNLKKFSLKELYGSNKHKEIIKKFVSGNYPDVCKNCSFYRASIPK